jgi:hypothetical protein
MSLFYFNNMNWAISLVVERRSPKPLVGVRFLHRPQTKNTFRGVFCLRAIASQLLGLRGGIEKLFHVLRMKSDKTGKGVLKL